MNPHDLKERVAHALEAVAAHRGAVHSSMGDDHLLHFREVSRDEIARYARILRPICYSPSWRDVIVYSAGASALRWDTAHNLGATNVPGDATDEPSPSHTTSSLEQLYTRLHAAAEAGREPEFRELLIRVETLEAQEAEHMSRHFWSRMPLQPGAFEALRRETEELLARDEDPSADPAAGTDGD